MERTILKASDGMILTDGKTFGRIVYLAQDADASEWREISEEEYREFSEEESGDQR